MARARGKGTPSRIRRNVQQYGDPYLPTFDPGEVAVCRICHAIFQRRHWSFNEREFRRLSVQRATRLIQCPACRKIADDYAEGEVSVGGGFSHAHRTELLNLIHNEAVRAMGINPLERIIRMSETDGWLRITTTNEKLAQRIGRALRRAYQGRVRYKWSADTKYLRVEWTRA
jgi:NMD protein affecting ribosome stability and mRNA decay